MPNEELLEELIKGPEEEANPQDEKTPTEPVTPEQEPEVKTPDDKGGETKPETPKPEDVTSQRLVALERQVKGLIVNIQKERGDKHALRSQLAKANEEIAKLRDGTLPPNPIDRIRKEYDPENPKSLTDKDIIELAEYSEKAARLQPQQQGDDLTVARDRINEWKSENTDKTDADEILKFGAELVKNNPVLQAALSQSSDLVGHLYQVGKSFKGGGSVKQEEQKPGTEKPTSKKPIVTSTSGGKPGSGNKPDSEKTYDELMAEERRKAGL